MDIQKEEVVVTHPTVDEESSALAQANPQHNEIQLSQVQIVTESQLEENLKVATPQETLKEEESVTQPQQAPVSSIANTRNVRESTRNVRENLRSAQQRNSQQKEKGAQQIKKQKQAGGQGTTKSEAPVSSQTPTPKAQAPASSSSLANTAKEFNEETERSDKNKGEKNYGELVRSLQYLRKFDWISQPVVTTKTPPAKFLTPHVFWFMVCAEFFPRNLTIANDPAAALEEVISKIDRQPIQQIIRIKEKVHNTSWIPNLHSIYLFKYLNHSIQHKKGLGNEANSMNTSEQRISDEDPPLLTNQNIDRNISEQGNLVQKQENISDVEEKQKIINAIRNLKFEIPPPNLRNSAELKADYTSDDDDYIMSVRYDLIDFYAKLFNNKKIGVEIPVDVAIHSNGNQLAQLDDDIPNEIKNKEEVDNVNENINNEDEQIKEENSLEKKAEAICEFENERVLKNMKKLDLEDLILAYQFQLSEQGNDTKQLVEAMKLSISREVASERQIFNASDLNFQDALVDIHYFNAQELEYLNLLENKQQYLDSLALTSNELSAPVPAPVPVLPATNSKQLTNGDVEQQPIILEDLACQVCNDGDYTDDDLIVFCSKCNISVHQRCYGIPKVPETDWICELCLAFGPEGRYLRCLLCSSRGGAMKPSRIPISSNIIAGINPGYGEFAAECCQTAITTKKQRYNEGCERSESTQVGQEEMNDDQDSQYYDFHTLKPFGLEELKMEPKPNFVWAHICCALWTPECFFDDKNHYSNIKGIENIDKNRFKLDCSICKVKGGSCIQCTKSKCMEAFHPECARRANRFMEIRNAEKLAYLIYCERHTPLKLRRQLESKEKKYKEEIMKFCRAVEKSREIRKKELGIAAMRTGGSTSDLGLSPSGKQSKKVHISAKKIRLQITKTEESIRKDERDFLQIFISKLIPFIEQSVNDGMSKQTEKEKKSARASSLLRVNTWSGILLKEKESPFWKQVDFKDETTIQIYKRFRKIQREIERKKEFRNAYFAALSSTRNIRVMSKEDKMQEKEKKRQEKIQKKQQRQKEIEEKANERIRKKLLKQEKKNKKTKKADAIAEAKAAAIAAAAQMNLEDEDEDVDYIIEQDDKLYCVCKQQYQDGELMMACEKCDEWYHLECVGFLGTMDDAETLDFVCKFCDISEGDQARSEERKARYGHFFSRFEEPNYDSFKRVISSTGKSLISNKKAKVNGKKEKKGKKAKAESKATTKKAKQSSVVKMPIVSVVKKSTRKRKIQTVLDHSEIDKGGSKKICVDTNQNEIDLNDAVAAASQEEQEQDISVQPVSDEVRGSHSGDIPLNDGVPQTMPELNEDSSSSLSSSSPKKQNGLDVAQASQTHVSKGLEEDDSDSEDDEDDADDDQDDSDDDEEDVDDEEDDDLDDDVGDDVDDGDDEDDDDDDVDDNEMVEDDDEEEDFHKEGVAEDIEEEENEDNDEDDFDQDNQEVDVEEEDKYDRNHLEDNEELQEDSQQLEVEEEEEQDMSSKKEQEGSTSSKEDRKTSGNSRGEIQHHSVFLDSSTTLASSSHQAFGVNSIQLSSLSPSSAKTLFNMDDSKKLKQKQIKDFFERKASSSS